MSGGGNKWILRPPQHSGSAVSAAQHKSTVVLRLFCIPQAGSGAWVYHEWQKHVPHGVEVLPIELPGRNTRMREPLLNSMTDLVNGIVLAIMPFLTDGIPFVIFGHSLGGWITYALTQELQLRALPLPCLIMVSGIRAPQLTGVIHDPDGVEMHKLGASDFWEAMERRYGRNPDLVDPAVRKLVHPILSADFKISETYRRASTAPLPCPVYFSGGKEDPRIRQDNVEVWKETVAKPEHCHIRWFKGGHNYLFNAKESKTEFLDYLTAQIKACLEQQGTETGLESGGTGIENGVARSQPSLPPSQSEHSDHLEKSVTQHPTPDCGASIQSGSDAGATVGSNSSYALTSSTKVTPPLTSYSPPPLAQIHTDSDMQTENAQERENERSEKAVERKSFFRWLCGRAL